MSPGANSQNSKSKSKPNVDFDDKVEQESGVKNRKKIVEGDDFDVVESEPDALTSSDDNEETCDPKKIESRAKKAKKEADRVKKRLAEISEVSFENVIFNKNSCYWTELGV